ncbi:MAG: GerW family sporulation protein [Lachnospiraceae bacterium]|nr:GerW family sporulation protein [Lachnospiraceae bacterium]
MSQNQSQYNSVVDSLLKGMGNLMSTHTVVGEPTTVGDALILPLVDVSFGLGAGAGKGTKKDSSSGGFGAKMSPSAVLIIQNGHTKLVSVKGQDAVSRIIDMVPDVVNRFTGKETDKVSDEEALNAAFPGEFDSKEEEE